MNSNFKKKIVSLEILLKKLKQPKFKLKKIGLCHGVFDLLHPGHILYLNEAKKNCDILIVSLTADEYVFKGPGRPYFKINDRINSIANILCVDFVVENKSLTAVNIISKIKPNYYIKGKDYLNKSKDVTGNIVDEEKAVKSFGGEIIFTKTPLFSSTKILNQEFEVFTKKQKKYIEFLKKKFSIKDIIKILDKAQNLKALVVGEAIVDQYIFCEALGKSGKESVLVMRKINNQSYVGGSVAISNLVSNFCKSSTVISYIGEKKEHEKFLKKNSNNNNKFVFFRKTNSPTVVKTRYIDKVTNSKLLGVYDINDAVLEKNASFTFLNLLKKSVKQNDIVIISDYDHGMLQDKHAKYLCKNSNFLSLNAQVNASNVGFHSLNKYKKVNCLVINETELRHELREREGEIKKLIKKLSTKMQAKYIVVTRGRDGSILFDKKNKTFVDCPAFESNPVDKIGSGDTLLAIFSIILFVSKSPELALLFGSLAAAHNVKNFANSNLLKSSDLKKLIQHIFK